MIHLQNLKGVSTERTAGEFPPISSDLLLTHWVYGSATEPAIAGGNFVKNTLKIMLVMVATLALSTAAWAFHSAGVAECAGCHTMHNSQDGDFVDAAHTGGNDYLLNYGNSSDTCLQCHAAYGQFGAGAGYGAGGDFYWVTKTWSWSAHGHAYESTGDSHGHNVISPVYGIAEDAILGSSPGGDFDSTYLTCTSCHDPHGNQNFRLLYGSMGPIYPGGRYSFTAGAPLATGLGRNSISASGQETDLAHTVYKSGMSAWCGNCHADMMSIGNTNHVHPAGEQLGSSISAVYNAYVSSDDLTGGDALTSYRGLVPFEDVNADLGTVNASNYTTGPESADQVMCLTCHRAHASPFPDAGRWDFGETFLADAHPASEAEGATVDDLANMWYNYTIPQNQRSLCNKCHAKDLGDAGY